MLVGVAGVPVSAACASRGPLVSTRSSCLTSERVPAVVAGQHCVVKCARGSAAACAADRAVVSGADAGVVPTSRSGRSSTSRRGRTMAARPLGERLCPLRLAVDETPHASDAYSKAVTAMVHASRCPCSYALCATPRGTPCVNPGCCRSCP